MSDYKEFDDDDLTDNREFEIESNTDELRRVYYHKTDTSGYDSSTFEVFSPEDIEKERLAKMREQRFANEEFGIAVESIEAKLGREINVDEFDKLCRSYATVLCEEDCKIAKTTSPDGEMRKKYYDDLINNRKVTRAFRNYYEKVENAKVADIENELKRLQQLPVGELEVKSGKPVNYRHKGKVKVQDDSNGLVYKIDNTADVKLLNMRNRQEWLDKRYSEEIQRETGDPGSTRNTDGFE